MVKTYTFMAEKTLVREVSVFNFVKEEDLVNVQKPIYGETTVYYHGYVEKLSRRMSLRERKVFLELILYNCDKDITPTVIYKKF